MLDKVDLVNNDRDKLLVSAICLAAWSLIYTTINLSLPLKQLSERKRNDTKNRIVSIIHGLLSFWLAVYEYFPYATYNLPNTQFQIFIQIISLTYCIYDLLACIYYKLTDGALISHHLFCITGFGFGILNGYGAIDGIVGLMIAESSNFPMHLRVILRNFGLKNTKAYETSENIYLLIYVLARGAILPFALLYPSLTSENSPIFVKLMAVTLSVQSWYFIYEMISIFKKKMKKQQQMKQKNVEFKWLQQNPQELKVLSFYKKQGTDRIF